MIYKLNVVVRTSVFFVALLIPFALEQTGSAQVIFENNFDQYSTQRVYTDADLDADWNTPVFNDGVTEGRVSIVGPSQAYGGTGSALAVFYPANKDGTKDTGAQWQLEFDDEHEELYLSYRVKFENGFDFVRGGKLPGLAGGTAPTGNTQADGTNGWTGRMMWRTDFTGVSGTPEQLVSEAVSYAKYTDSGFGMDGEDEDKEYWIDSSGDRVEIVSGQWYQIKQRVKMNEAGQSDGILQIWLDDQLVHDQQDVLFRTTSLLKIDQMYFSTFFGGNEDWATSKDETVYFDDFEIYQVTPTVQPRFLKVPDKYATIQEALDAAVPGDTVAVNGLHTGNFVVDKAILFRGYTGTRITSLSSNQPVIRVTAPAAYVKRFVTVGGTQGVLVEAGNENVVVDFVRAYGTSSAGVFVQPGCHNAKISKNVVDQSAGGCGIIVSGSDDVEVNDNRVYSIPTTAFLIANAERCELDGNLAYIGNNGYSISGSENEIIDNRAIRNTGYGFWITGDDNVVFDNSTVSNGSHGFSFYGSSNNLITENMSRYDDGNGFQILLGSDDNTLIDNTARFGDGIGFSVQASDGNSLDDNWSDDNVNGFIFGSASSSTSVTNNRSEDNDNFGILDLGTGNTFGGNISRRNGTN